MACIHRAIVFSRAPPPAPLKPVLAGAAKAAPINAQAAAGDARSAGGRRGNGGGRGAGTSKDFLWEGWVLPASDADAWLASGAVAYHEALSGNDLDKRVEAFRAEFRAAALEGDQALS